MLDYICITIKKSRIRLDSITPDGIDHMTKKLQAYDSINEMLESSIGSKCLMAALDPEAWWQPWVQILEGSLGSRCLNAALGPGAWRQPWVQKLEGSLGFRCLKAALGCDAWWQPWVQMLEGSLGFRCLNAALGPEARKLAACFWPIGGQIGEIN